MRAELVALDERARAEFAHVDGEESLAAWRKQYLNKKKGVLAPFYSSMRDLDPDQRKSLGQELQALSQSWGQLGIDNAEQEQQSKSSGTDHSLPLPTPKLGSRHPLSLTRERLLSTLQGLGFKVATGPHIESEYFNFDALNIPGHHPAREMQDTFYVDLPDSDQGKWPLRTHTSPVQIRYMQNNTVPIRMVAPGRVYRADSDATHSPMFQQIEGLWIEEGVSFAHLKGMLRYLMSALFEKDLKVRLRPSYFPFTEPSAEVDLQCFACESGCRVCSQTGWIEVLGCGMVHPNVLEAGGIDSSKHSGMAFGIGIERMAMLKYGLRDIRHFYRGSLEISDQLRGTRP